MNTRRGIIATYHTDIEKELKVGDEVLLPTMFDGMCKFKIVSIKGDSALAETKYTGTRLHKLKDGLWRNNHFSWPKDMVVKGIVTKEEK